MPTKPLVEDIKGAMNLCEHAVGNPSYLSRNVLRTLDSADLEQIKKVAGGTGGRDYKAACISACIFKRAVKEVEITEAKTKKVS